MPKTIIKRIKDKPKFLKISDEDKYLCLKMYSEGVSPSHIGSKMNVDTNSINSSISNFIKTMNLVQESNKLPGSKICSIPNLPTPKTSKEITEEFKEDAQTNGLIFAWYYGKTNDIRYSLRASDLDKGIGTKIPVKTKNYILRVRGQYLLSIPAIQKEVETVRNQVLLENNVDRQYVISEILGQLEEEKILREDNPQSRTNSIKLIKLLGDSVSAFSTNINVSEVNPEDSLNVLIEMAKEDIEAESTYMIEDTKEDREREEDKEEGKDQEQLSNE